MRIVLRHDLQCQSSIIRGTARRTIQQPLTDSTEAASRIYGACSINHPIHGQISGMVLALTQAIFLLCNSCRGSERWDGP